MPIETLALPGDRPAPVDDAQPARNPALVLTAALDGWAEWLPGDGTSYHVHVTKISGGTDHADRVLLINCVGTTVAVQYAAPEVAAYRVEMWTRRRWVATGLHRVGEYDMWPAAFRLLHAAGVA